MQVSPFSSQICIIMELRSRTLTRLTDFSLQSYQTCDIICFEETPQYVSSNKLQIPQISALLLFQEDDPQSHPSFLHQIDFVFFPFILAVM